jgi:hypothetical protein
MREMTAPLVSFAILQFGLCRFPFRRASRFRSSIIFDTFFHARATRRLRENDVLPADCFHHFVIRTDICQSLQEDWKSIFSEPAAT